MHISKYPYILLLLLLPFLGACSDSDSVDQPDPAPEGTATRFEMKVKDVGGSIAVRADGSIDESKINNLKLFVVPLDANGNEIRNSSDIYVLDPVSLSTPAPDGTINAVFVSVIPVGMKHLYIGANLTSVQAGNIRNNWRYTLNSINNSEVVNPLTTNGIVMWSQVMVTDANGSTTPDIEIIANQGIVSNLQTVSLERVVAKVLLTTESDANGYVAVSKEGWIKLEDIRYALEKTAKAFEWTSPAVPGDIQPEGLTNIVSYQDRNTAEWHISVKAAQNSDNYTGGIYCLENPAGNAEADDNATRMVVAAQFIPKQLYVADGEGYRKQTFTTIDEAIAAINAEKGPGAVDKTYYWLKDTDESYTYEAMQNKIRSGTEVDSFSMYEGGWGYYMTYVDGITNTSQRGIQWDREKSVIHRNSYHILKITRFNPPGIGELNELTFEEDIHVSATVVDWTDRGGTNSDLEFNDAEQNQNR